jgi:outer membrane protein assembly factor BamD
MSYFNRIKTVDVSYYFAKKALEEFEKLRTEYPRNPYMNIVESRIRWCKRVLAEYEFYVGKFYFKKGSYTAARNRFEGLLKTYPNARIRPDALYYLGLSYKEEGNFDRAREVFQRLIQEFPSINLASKAREILASIQEK